MSRDWRVDALRGYFLVLMTLGHFPNPLARFTEYSFGYASAPDGFVFLSGLVASWVYLRVWQKSGQDAMQSKIFRRSGQIYLTHMVLFAMGILFALLAGAQSFRGLHPYRALALGSLLLDQGGFDKILPMYSVFLLFTPVILKQLAKGRAKVVVLVSASLWVCAQFGIGDNTARLPWLNLGTFNLLAWQAYFVAGLYFGNRGVKRPAFEFLNSRVLLVVCAGIATALMVDRHLHTIAGVAPLLGFSGHPDHNPARFLDALCLGYILYRIPRVVDRTLMKFRAARFCNFIGQHSLQVFVFSMLVTRFEAHVTARLPWIAILVLTLATVASLYFPARIHEMYRRRRRETASSATLLRSPSIA